jgi:hypothetical protein
MGMVDDNSLGLDSFLCKFYKTKWNFVGSNLFLVCKEDIRKNSLGDCINKDIIKFIPKNGDPKLISNHRSITSLNYLYKSTTNDLNIHVKHIFLKIIHLEHTHFIRGRFILEDFIAVWKGMEWAICIYLCFLFIKIEYKMLMIGLSGPSF